ncbi:hypothetical protein K1719_029039 [Acacia pycnantha]|nr:hypothetical protein K1719_029039 [Acacia pycnantha]
MGVDKGQVRFGQDEGSEKVQREVYQSQQQKKGAQDTRREAIRGSDLRAANNRGTVEMEGRKDKAGKERTVVVTNMNEAVRVGASEPLKVHNNNECVPASNLELYKWHEVKRAGKENLNPGDPCIITQGKTSMGSRDSQMVGTDEDLIEPFRMSMEEGVLAPRATDARTQDQCGFSKQSYQNWGFKHSVRREAEGFSGGIWILWNLDDLLVDVVMLEDQFIHCNLVMSGTKMCFTAVYASPNEQRRHRTWDMLLTLSQEITDPWLLAGDFNDIKTPMKQKGVVESVRLDRCLCNVLWQEKFANAQIKVVSRVCSDHHPLVVCLEAPNKGYRHKPFRYEAAWQMHGTFDEVVRENWLGEDEAHAKLSSLKQSLVQWNKDIFGNIESRGGS